MFWNERRGRWSSSMLVSRVVASSLPSISRPDISSRLPCLVINQMDTSGTTLGPRSASAPKPENFSKDELSAILKFVFHLPLFPPKLD